MRNIELGLCETAPFPKDLGMLSLHCTGGLRAAQFKQGWSLEPIPLNNKPSVIGYFSDDELDLVLENVGALPICFEHSGHIGGGSYSFLRPWSPTARKVNQSARDLWSSASGQSGNHSARELELARNIFLAITSVEIHLSRLSRAYYAQLMDALHKGTQPGQRFVSGCSDEIAASVHDFYTAACTGRDHLAGLIALRLGKRGKGKRGKVADKLSELLPLLSNISDVQEPMFTSLKKSGHVKFDGKNWRTQGALKEIGSLRNAFVHATPYGALEKDKWGQIVEARGAANMPVKLYAQNLIIPSGNTVDLLGKIREHYLIFMQLFEEMSRCSGLDLAIQTFGEGDIEWIELNRQ